MRKAHNRLNLVGKRFTRLTVISDFGNHPTTGESYWQCQCDCGEIIQVTGYSLTSGNTKSCGCYHKIHTRQLFSKPIVDLTLSRVIHDYKSSAQIKKHSFDLTKDQVSRLIFSECYYCGAKPSNSYRTSSGRTLLPHQGIDRKDNSKGYTVDNVVPCCIVCNKMKKTLGHDEFLLHIHRIALRFEVEPTQPDFQYEVCGGLVLCKSE